MMKWSGPVLGLVLVLAAAGAHALPPTDAQSDAFVRIYAFGVLKAMLSETLTLKAEAGRITQTQADCAIDKVHFEDMLPRARTIVAASFPSAEALNEATAFFSSATGVKLSEFGATTLRDYLRARAHGKTPPTPASFPPSFTTEDVNASAKFNVSAAGADFSRFVKEGLPRMNKVDLVQPALAACSAAM